MWNYVHLLSWYTVCIPFLQCPKYHITGLENHYIVSQLNVSFHMLLSSWHGMSSICRGRRRPPDIIVPANVLNSSLRQPTGGGPSALGLGEGLATTQCENLTCHLFLKNSSKWTDPLGWCVWFILHSVALKFNYITIQMNECIQFYESHNIMTQAAPVTVFSAQFNLLRTYYRVRICSSCMQKTLSNSLVQLCVLWWGATSEAWNM